MPFDDYINDNAKSSINTTLGGDPGSSIAQRIGENTADYVGGAAKAHGPAVERIIISIAKFPEFQWHYTDNLCWRQKINSLYKVILYEKAETAPTGDELRLYGRNQSELQEKASGIILADFYLFAAEEVYRKKFEEARIALVDCLGQKQVTTVTDNPNPPYNPKLDLGRIIISPFDRRVDKLAADSVGGGLDAELRIPYNTGNQRVSTSGYIISQKALAQQFSDVEKSNIIKAHQELKDKLRLDDLYIGVDSLINPYAITKLYGSEGGQYLLDQKGKRRWYEIDNTNQSADFANYSKNPTTTSLINWGNGDPYGRTPYHFTDFAFCKHWNLIQNNRMITLRRFPAPILDNMKFPGIEGAQDSGTAAIEDDENTTPKTNVVPEGGNNKSIAFPPMATAITYFGEETENQLSNLLKFSTGVKWDEVTADLHKPTNEAPDLDAGAGGLSDGLTKYAKMFNIATGNYNQSNILNKGAKPPDPYIDGPYENRIIGPVNRIESVKKRKAGLKYEHPLDLTFEYVARPIGGINLKAALLEVLSNFLVIGSASAVFWGGQHRFMGDPIKYPFIGGDKGMESWYKGDPVGWGKETVQEFATGVSSVGNGIADFFKSMLSAGSGGDVFGGIANLFKDKGIGSNILKAKIAEKSSGQIPYLQGMKALLIGEPVGEWHVTIGNPLNPIAMIGNLICDGIDIEFGNELGPDDFPLDMKVIVHLDHGMARDKDAIQSIFNRGMGRIYELPDDFTGSADYTTTVDNQTKNPPKNDTGYQPTYYKVPIGNSQTEFGNYSKPATRSNALGGNVSIWNRASFAAMSPNQDIDLSRNNIQFNRSAFRSGTWIGLKSLK
jgi:hypothetical protein